MDFVVIGLGLSALALLAGLALLCLISPSWFRKAGPAKPDDAAYARAMAGERHALGQGFLCVGAVLLLTTLGGISGGLADKTGAYLIAAMTTVALLGLVGWDALYRRQHPVPRRRRVATVKANPATDSSATTRPAALAPATLTPATTTVRRRVLPARQRTAPAGVPAAAEGAPLDFGYGEVDHSAAEDLAFAAPLPAADGPDAAATVAVESAPSATEDLEPEAPAAAQEANATSATNPEGEPASAPDEEQPTATPGAAEVAPQGDAAASAAPEPVTATDTMPDFDENHFGDDKVIALFPTAATRRGGATVAPPNSHGKD